MVELAGLSDAIGRTIREYLETVEDADIVRGFVNPKLRVEAFLLDGVDAAAGRQGERFLGSTTLELMSMRASNSPRDLDEGGTPQTLNNAADQEHSLSQGPNEDSTEDDSSSDDESEQARRRKATGGLRLTSNLKPSYGQLELLEESQRQLQVHSRSFPKRRKIRPDTIAMQPSSLDKLVIGIWEQLHGSINLDPQAILESYRLTLEAPDGGYLEANGTSDTSAVQRAHTFSQMNVFCRKVTQASRACRSVELIVQAHWVEHFDARVDALVATTPQLSASKHRKAALMEACQDFGWTEKELRNKLAIWRGYHEVKEAGGWAALIFSGMGLYRFCKYRVGFDKEATQRLRALRPRFEVAADTLHPHWRQLLTVIGENSTRIYDGHPHDWVVSENGAMPITLRQTYLQWDPQFSFEHLDDSIIDERAWGCDDPRWLAPPDPSKPGRHVCRACGEVQDDNSKTNDCHCFPNLFGGPKRTACPVQVMHINGKNNGLVACIPFERGSSIGEFTGLLTHSLANTDVMTASSPSTNRVFQIDQKRYGNHTRFVNHSCNPNAQFQQFAWLDTVRIVLVSKGIAAGEEVTVDYSDRYWDGLDKDCLCGEACCRYKRHSRGRTVARGNSQLQI